MKPRLFENQTVFPQPIRLLCSTTAITLLITTLMAIPAIAEEPTDNLSVVRKNNTATHQVRQNNIRRLILLNECAGCDLSEVDLTAAHLIGADLRDANLQFANLTNSNLEGADLTGANLTGANLTNTFLTNASLANAQLKNTNFSNAHLYYVNVAGATIDSPVLTGAQLLNTNISVGGEQPTTADEIPQLPAGIRLEQSNPEEIR